MHSQSRRCDLSGQWVPVLAAAAIVMIITAASMFSASKCLCRSPASLPFCHAYSLTHLRNTSTRSLYTALFMQRLFTCIHALVQLSSKIALTYES